jgi:pantetheine-phosphate adenylyltransferase
MTKIAIFPGTFDPITLGHQDLIQRAASLFDKIIVAVAENEPKAPIFTLDQRISMAQEALQKYKNVQVQGFNNLLVDFAKSHDAVVILRGVRIANDFEYELQLAYMNKSLNPKIETLFLTPEEKYSYISSTFVREIAKLKGDVSSFVNPQVKRALEGVKWR